MGIYINNGSSNIKTVLKGEYVDKTGIFAVVNSTLGTLRQYSHATHCRRLGKTMTADMPRTYYGKGGGDGKRHSCKIERLQKITKNEG